MKANMINEQWPFIIWQVEIVRIKQIWPKETINAIEQMVISPEYEFWQSYAPFAWSEQLPRELCPWMNYLHGLTVKVKSAPYFRLATTSYKHFLSPFPPIDMNLVVHFVLNNVVVFPFPLQHRLRTIMNSDKILVLDNGRLAEYDEPSILLSNRDSLFASLVREAYQE